jgi:hypothetical protein
VLELQTIWIAKRGTANEIFGYSSYYLQIIYTTNLLYVGLKVEKRLSTWQGVMLSSGGKSILIESSLRSLPNYTMGVYLLPEEVHHKMDSDRANFYWDAGKKRKYHMVKLADLARPKDFGVLRFTDMRLMNKCLLSKWIIKVERGDTDLCIKMLRNKYLKENFFTVMLEGVTVLEKAARG